MKAAARALAIGIWLAGGTLLLGRWYFANPDSFPRLPEWLWHALDEAFGASNVDGSADVEFVVVVLFAFVTVAAGTYLANALWKRLRPARR